MALRYAFYIARQFPEKEIIICLHKGLIDAELDKPPNVTFISEYRIPEHDVFEILWLINYDNFTPPPTPSSSRPCRAPHEVDQMGLRS